MSFEISDIAIEFEIELSKKIKMFEKNLNDFSIRRRVNQLGFDKEGYPIIPAWLFDQTLRSMIKRRGEESEFRSIEIELKNKLFGNGFVYLCDPKKFIHMDRNKIKELA